MTVGRRGARGREMAVLPGGTPEGWLGRTAVAVIDIWGMDELGGGRLAWCGTGAWGGVGWPVGENMRC